MANDRRKFDNEDKVQVKKDIVYFEAVNYGDTNPGYINGIKVIGTERKFGKNYFVCCRSAE